MPWLSLIFKNNKEFNKITVIYKLEFGNTNSHKILMEGFNSAVFKIESLNHRIKRDLRFAQKESISARLELLTNSTV